MCSTLLELFWSCVKIGLLAFGGGNAAIPLLEAAAVPRWMSQQEFGELVSINFAFPGISILKLAVMVGLRTAGTPGLLLAVIGLASPGLVLTIGAYSLLTSSRTLNPLDAYDGTLQLSVSTHSFALCGLSLAVLSTKLGSFLGKRQLSFCCSSFSSTSFASSHER